MNYSIVPINSNNQYAIYGVSLGDKKFMYWKNKSSQIDKEVMVIFNQNYGNVSVVDGMVILSLAGLNNYDDIRNAMVIFKGEILKNQSVQVQFVVGNENEQRIAEALGREIGGNYTIHNVNERMQVVKEQLQEQASQEMSAVGSQNIQKSDEYGQLKKYMVQDNKIYENNGTLSLEEMKEKKLAEWMNDSVRLQQISSMSREALDKALTEAVTIGATEYRLESANEQVAGSKVGNVAMARAQTEDGRVNSQLGIVQNNPASSNQFSLVEQRGDKVQIVNPSVMSSQVSSNGDIVSSVSSASVDFNYGNVDGVKVENQEVQSRSIEKEFFIDRDYNIYGKNGQFVSKVGQNGYIPNYNDNTLMKDGQVIGVIGDYQNMGHDNSNVYSKPVVRTLKKNDGKLEKTGGFVSFPVILFILSAILLIASIVLLFVVD